MQSIHSSPSGSAGAEKSFETGQVKLTLRLFVAGNTSRSLSAIRTLRQVCEAYLAGLYKLDVIDIHQQPDLAREAQIIATPTLIKVEPSPKKVMVGDFSRTERVLSGLGIAG